MSSSFQVDCRAFMERTRMKAHQVIRAVGVAMYQDVTIRTRVKTGRCRANWNCTLNGINRSTDNNTQLDVMRADATFKGAEAGDTLTISNSLPYASKLEQLDGMMRCTVVDIKDRLENGGIGHD